MFFDGKNIFCGNQVQHFIICKCSHDHFFTQASSVLHQYSTSFWWSFLLNYSNSNKEKSFIFFWHKCQKLVHSALGAWSQPFSLPGAWCTTVHQAVGGTAVKEWPTIRKPRKPLVKKSPCVLREKQVGSDIIIWISEVQRDPSEGLLLSSWVWCKTTDVSPAWEDPAYLVNRSFSALEI